MEAASSLGWISACWAVNACNTGLLGGRRDLRAVVQEGLRDDARAVLSGFRRGGAEQQLHDLAVVGTELDSVLSPTAMGGFRLALALSITGAGPATSDSVVSTTVCCWEVFARVRGERSSPGSGRSSTLTVDW